MLNRKSDWKTFADGTLIVISLNLDWHDEETTTAKVPLRK